MKKTLIALAALAATASFAQSSVTLYGVADIAVGVVSGNTGAGNSIAAQTNNAFNNGNSRIGFRGVEDLGGGLKASFNFEGNVDLANGGTSGTVAAPLTYSRAAWLALDGGFGQVKLGRQFDPEFLAVAAYELTGAANYSAVVGNLVGTLRTDAMVSYTTPNMGGLTAMVGVQLPGNNQVGGLGGLTTTSMNVIYANGPIAAAASYRKVDNASEAAWTIGGSYNLGVAKVAAGYYNLADLTPAVGIATKDVRGWSLGASAPVGPATLTIDLARANGRNLTGVGPVADSTTDILFEAKYPLSKRTTVYAALLNKAERTIGAGSVNNIGLGIRHNF